MSENSGNLALVITAVALIRLAASCGIAAAASAQK